MAAAQSLTILLVNEHAEEIKQATISMRQFYPGCRVEVVYTGEEALEWASKEPWQVILLDQSLSNRSKLDIVPELRRRAPHSAIIVQAEHTDVRTAAHAIRTGADYHLHKGSPVFFTDLAIVTREILEKRNLRKELELLRERHVRLVQALPDLLAYELDAEGRFMTIGADITKLLDYAPEELIGTHYASILDPTEQRATRFLFHERRTGARTTLHTTIRLAGKNAQIVTVTCRAAGLYSRDGQFLGTVGTITKQPFAPTGPPVSKPLHRPSALPTRPSLETAEPVIRETLTLYPERRKAPRLTVRALVDIKFNDTLHKATLHDMSLSGLYLTSAVPLSVNEHQPVQLGFTSDIGVLDVHGTIRGIREEPQEHGNYVNTSMLGIAIHYPSLNPINEKVLASLLEEIREHPSALKLTVLFVPLETGDLLLEISSASADAVDVKPIHPGQSYQTDALPVDRRLAGRVNLALSAWLRFTSSGLEQRVQTANFSVGGTGIHLVTQHQPIERQVELKLTSPEHVMGGESLHEIRVDAEIMWMIQDRPATPGLPTESSDHAYRLGLRFSYPDDESQRMIARLVGKFLGSPHRVEERRGTDRVISALLEHRNPHGQRIALYHDHPRTPLPPGSPLILIAPGYGETKKEYVALAHHFAINGCHVLRYDHTNHVGESDGNILYWTLTHMRQDLIAMLNFAERGWPASPIAVVATSLAGRVALKAAAEDPRVKLLLLLAGVVDLQATLEAVHNEDLIGTYRLGVRRGVVNVLGFSGNLDNFLNDAIESGYADLQTTLADAGHIRTPVILFTAEQDAWVRLESVKAVQTALGPHLRHLYLIPEALHRLHENPVKASAVFRQLLSCCLDEFYPLTSQGTIVEPSLREIRFQGRLERERSRTQHLMAKGETLEFWRDYLAHFHYIVNSSDYWHLLDQIYSLIGSCDHEEKILDAGCGNGNLGAFLLINRAYSARASSKSRGRPAHYLGMDFVPAALVEARRNFSKVHAESQGSPLALVDHTTLLKTSLCLADLNLPLPFRDSEFDRVVSNLVIGYVQDPLYTLRELLRTLKPRGRLIITNLKPHADLSQIYRNFVEEARSTEEIEEARQALNNSGKIKQGESDGIFRFFDKQELVVLLTSAGVSQPRIYSTFANQAFIAVAEKQS